jgi:hypothetical protein
MMNDPNVFSSPCAICKVRKAVRWCDFVIEYNRNIIFVKGHQKFIELNSTPNDETCDLPLCDICSHEEGKADLCPHHYKLHKQAELPADLKKYQVREKMKIRNEIIRG